MLGTGLRREGAAQRAAPPQHGALSDAARHVHDRRLRRRMAHLEPREACGGAGAGQRHPRPAAAAVGRAHQPARCRGEQLARIGWMNGHAPAGVGQHAPQRRAAVAAGMQRRGAGDPDPQRVGGVDREVVHADAGERGGAGERPGLAGVGRAQQAEAVGDLPVAVAGAGVHHVGRAGRLRHRPHHKRRLLVGQRRPGRAGIAAAPQAAAGRAQQQVSRVVAVDDDAAATPRHCGLGTGAAAVGLAMRDQRGAEFAPSGQLGRDLNAACAATGLAAATPRAG